MKCVVSLLSAIAMAAANAAVLNTAEESIGVVELGKTVSVAYNPEWCGVADGDDVLSVVSVNGEEVCSRTGAGSYEWTPLAPGEYRLSVRASMNGVATGSELSRTIWVQVSGEQGIPLCSGSSTTYLKEIPTYPWQRRTAAASESLTYSSAWATNAASGAKAVVKAMPVLKQKPKYLVVDLSGGTNATSYALSYLDDVPEGGWSDEYKTSKLVLRHIPAGSARS